MGSSRDLDRQKDLPATFGVMTDLLVYQHSRLVQNPRKIKTVLHCLITYFVPKKHFLGGSGDLDRQKDLPATFGVRTTSLAYQQSRLVQNPRKIKTVLHCLITCFVPKKHSLGRSGDLDQQKDLPATFGVRTNSLTYQQSRLVQNPRKIKTVLHCLITYFMQKNAV